MPNDPVLPPSEPSTDDLMAELLVEDLQYRKNADPDVSGRRVKIQINNVPLDDQTSLAMQALYSSNNPPRIFSRACALSRVRYDERNIAIIEPLDQYAIRYYLARSAFFVKVTADIFNAILLGRIANAFHQSIEFLDMHGPW